ncbi:MAG TPA: putative quinol monooxygenase [Methylomirabilota bacterium]|jgi:quinol monooxygenase YgiN|nr:putative quinol monooxygenase [Methylomirabilota bacterium]
MADVLTVIAKIRAVKGKGDALAALLKEQVAVVTKAEPGLLIYRPHRSSKDPDLFIFYEQYKDDAAFELHRKAPYLAAYRERREKEGLTVGPAEVEIYRSLTD